MELIFLGTGAAIPARNRNVTSIALSMLNERNAIWLFDVGEGTQHQILKSSVKLSKLEKIFITHMHGDHIFGLSGLLSSRSFQGGTTPLTVYGPVGIREYIETTLELSGTRLAYSLTIQEIKSEFIFSDAQFEVTCMELDHSIQSFGFRITEKDKPGTLDAAKLEKEGVPPGPHFQRLKMGEKITLTDGRVINGNDYLSAQKRGRVIAIFGDTKQTANAKKLAQDADVIVHEATFEAEKSQLAHEYGHSTTKDAAEVAKQAKAKRLILTHISSRYDKEASHKLLKEAQDIFPLTDIAADFDIFTISEAI